PTVIGGKINGAKHRFSSDYDASAPTLYELIKARTDIPVSSIFILFETPKKFNNKIMGGRE
ncbi:MAG: hypothetical protein ACLRFK_01845, partial [Alphaproteobacteria bacterium]